MRKLSDEKLRDLLNEKFADYEGEVPQNSWTTISQRIVVKSAKGVKFAQSSLMVTVGLIALWFYTPTERAESKSFKGTYAVHADRKEISIAYPTTIKTTTIKEDEQPVTVSSSFVAAEHHTLLSIPEISVSVSHEPIKELKLKRNKVKKSDRPMLINFAAGTFMSYKSVSPNRLDQMSLTNFSSPKGFAASRIGYQAAASITVPFPKMDLEAGLSFTHFSSSMSYNVRNAYDEISKRNELRSVYNMIGIRGALHFPLRYGKLMAGIDWQLFNSNTNTLKNQSLLTTRIGYSFDVVSSENMNLAIRPVISYSLTTINMGAIAVRPYTFGVEAVISSPLF